jgi:putative (di)nucleoside polyphosphate hydrolase
MNCGTIARVQAIWLLFILSGVVGFSWCSTLIDAEGFRPNVGIVLANSKGQVFWGRRVRQQAWQFPQGGIQVDEDPEQAMLRELNEEVGLTPGDVRVIAVTNGWLHYRLPQRMVRQHESPVCVGQKQKWFLLEMLSGDERVKVDHTSSPEFDNWRWVSYWYPLGQVVSFKRDVYRQAMRELSGAHSRLVSNHFINLKKRKD